MRGADVVVEATRLPAPAPILRTEWIAPAALVIPYGTMSAVELSLTSIMDKVFVDDWGQCQARALRRAARARRRGARDRARASPGSWPTSSPARARAASTTASASSSGTAASPRPTSRSATRCSSARWSRTSAPSCPTDDRPRPPGRARPRRATAASCSSGEPVAVAPAAARGGRRRAGADAGPPGRRRARLRGQHGPRLPGRHARSTPERQQALQRAHPAPRGGPRAALPGRGRARRDAAAARRLPQRRRGRLRRAVPLPRRAAQRRLDAVGAVARHHERGRGDRRSRQLFQTLRGRGHGARGRRARCPRARRWRRRGARAVRAGRQGGRSRSSTARRWPPPWPRRSRHAHAALVEHATLAGALVGRARGRVRAALLAPDRAR